MVNSLHFFSSLFRANTKGNATHAIEASSVSEEEPDYSHSQRSSLTLINEHLIRILIYVWVFQNLQRVFLLIFETNIIIVFIYLSIHFIEKKRNLSNTLYTQMLSICSFFLRLDAKWGTSEGISSDSTSVFIIITPVFIKELTVWCYHTSNMGPMLILKKKCYIYISSLNRNYRVMVTVFFPCYLWSSSRI